MQPVTASAKEDAPLISMQGICKAFPGVVANDNIAFDVHRSEIHALLGENGAGKSTLMKILYGFYRADAGEVLLEGQSISISSPSEARAARIGMVFQDFSLIPAFSVAENIALFLPHLSPLVDLKDVSRRIEETSARYGLQVDPRAMVSELSVGEQQKAEIMKLLLSDARLLILDEPTRVLAPHEVDALFQVLDGLRADGYAIVLITHKIKEVLQCADRITVLRRGKVAGALLRRDASEAKLVELMFERKLSALKTGEKPARDAEAAPLLELQDIHTQGQGAQVSLKDIDLQVFPGEIVGIAGVSGNGQRELGDVALGMIRSVQGRKCLFGKDVTNCSIGKIRRQGVAFIPENPLTMASAPFLTVMENMAVPQTWRYARNGGFSIDWQAIRADIEHAMAKLGFSFSLFVPARSLSGGNLQRMVIVRELSHDPHLIIASYITRGLDAQSTIAARQALVQARQRGAGVLLISEDLEELFALSDRLIVLYEGAIAGRFRPQETDVYQVGHLMTGSGVGA
jgi:ABC-type uncharacterized transport system ATPase subunit